MKKIVVIKNKESGQSIIEMIFAITIVALVITGVVVLIVTSIGSKNRSFSRKKAMEMAEVVMENLVDQKRNNSTVFWEKSSKIGETLPNFLGYSYNVGYSGMNCGTNDCAMVTVTVKWGDNQNISINKFFSKEVN
jgi:type II secretory pathway pseudopilin PulG